MLKTTFLRLFSVVFVALLAGACSTAIVESKPCLEAKSECFENIIEAAEQGQAEAQNRLGFMYDEGIGVEMNKENAVYWYRLAAEQGFMETQFNLGQIYLNGKNVAKDAPEAIRWYRLAAEQGHVTAQFNLGRIYQNGKDVKKDSRKAAHWYRKAAEQGVAQAQFNIAVMYFYGEGVKKNSPEAYRWYHLAAKKGYVRKAAEKGDADAQFIIGRMYSNGDGLVKNEREAARWYQLAAKQGHAAAQNNLGVLYYYGNGVIENEYEAHIWILIAKAGGNDTATENLRDLPWRNYLTSTQIQSARYEAVRRFEEFDDRKNKVQDTDNNSVKKDGGEFTVAKPPEQANIAATVFENTWRSVVMIKNNAGQGSGVIIRPNLVATNCHVIEGGGIAVYKPENQKINENTPFSAKIVHRKEEHDFCILEVKGLWGIAATIRKYDTLQVGENVYALGAPSGLDLSLSDGLISQLRADNGTRVIQTNAAISPGSSGGGLFDAEGNFIGILTSKYVGDDIEGIGFAIPADLSLEF